MNKNILLILLTCGFVIKANSQITKGNWLVGGSANYTADKYSVNNSTQVTSQNFALLPYIGYFLKDKFAIGLAPGIAYLQTKDAPQKVSVTSYLIVLLCVIIF